MNKDCSKEDKVTKQLKKALAALDTAVQKWYGVNAPGNTERYASCHIRNYPDGRHVSNITLLPDPIDNIYNYVDIASSKEDK